MYCNVGRNVVERGLGSGAGKRYEIETLNIFEISALLGKVR